MNTNEIIAALDAAIARLQNARIVIANSSPVAKRRGRPPASASSGIPHKRRTLSAEAREKIASAQRKRWAKQKRRSKI